MSIICENRLMGVRLKELAKTVYGICGIMRYVI